MEEKRKIPYGVMNWDELVRECFVVDNTRYIRELETIKTPVFLRPKRFGKTVVCSMLAHYYDVNLKDRFEELFGKTDIGRNPTPLRNSFLVLPFDFSTVQVGTLAEIERNFWEKVKRSVGSFAVKYAKLADWSGVAKAQNPADMIDAVRAVIKDAHLPPLYVIIDEYDNFTNELVVSGRDAEYNAVCGHDAKGDATRESFFKAFFKSFKVGLADGTVGRTYFTGVLPITLDDLSSGFNVGTIVNLNPDLLNLVGFTQSQVEKYVDDVYAEYGFDRSNRADVLADLKEQAEEEVAAEAEAAGGEGPGEEASKDEIAAAVSSRYLERRADVLKFVESWFRDIMAVVAAGDGAPLENGAYRAAIAKAASGISVADAFRNVEAVEALARTLKRGVPEAPSLTTFFQRIAVA